MKKLNPIALAAALALVGSAGAALACVVSVGMGRILLHWLHEQDL